MLPAHTHGLGPLGSLNRNMVVHAEHVANLPDLQNLLISSKHSAEAVPLLERLNAHRPPELPRLRAVSLPTGGNHASQA